MRHFSTLFGKTTVTFTVTAQGRSSLPLAARATLFPLALAFRKPEASFPLQRTGAYHLEGTIVANRPAASRNCDHSCCFSDPPLGGQ